MTIVFVLAGTAMMVALLLAVYAWWRGDTLGARPFALLIFAVAWWCLGVILGIASPDLPTKLFWAKFVFFPIVTVPVAWLAFILEYTGRAQWLSRRNVLLLSIEPVITFVLAWTNEYHKLIYTSTQIDLSNGFPMVQSTFGPWLWVHAAYGYSLMLVGTLLLIWTTFRMPSVYRLQAISLLIGSLFPWFSNIVSISGLNPIPALDLTPIAFAFSGVVFAWGLFRLGLLDLLPVARDMVIEQMADGLMVLDARDRILDANPALQRLVGLPMNKIIGNPVDEFFPNWRRLIESTPQGSVQKEISLNSGAGQSSYAVRITSLFNQEKRLTGRVVTLDDVTDRKRAEDTMQQAKEAAEASNRAKDKFLAAVSYELRTPLTTITGYSSTLLAQVDQNGPRHILKYVESIHSASQHLLAITNRLLDLTRIEMNAVPLTLKIFDFVGVVNDAVKSIQPLAQQNNNTLQLNCPAAFGIYADKEKVSQIVLTLLDNACRQTNHGTISVSVSRQVDQDSEWVTFSVQDTGAGISSEQLVDLFEPFTQADRTHVREFGGTGLSLPLSQRYCKMMRGTIEVTSEKGKGSTFTVRLPQHAEPK